MHTEPILFCFVSLLATSFAIKCWYCTNKDQKSSEKWCPMYGKTRFDAKYDRVKLVDCQPNIKSCVTYKIFDATPLLRDDGAFNQSVMFDCQEQSCEAIKRSLAVDLGSKSPSGKPSHMMVVEGEGKEACTECYTDGCNEPKPDMFDYYLKRFPNVTLFDDPAHPENDTSSAVPRVHGTMSSFLHLSLYSMLFLY